MKQVFGVSALILASLLLSPSVHAQIYSLQYTTNGSAKVSAATPPTAGVYNVADFNVQNLGYVSGTGATTTDLMSSTGDTSTISATVSSLGGYDSGGGNKLTGGNHNLANAYALTDYGSFSGTPLTLTLTGLNPTDTYTLEAYVFDNDATKASLSAGGSTFYFAGATNPLTSLTQITQTSSTGAATNGDYATFTLTGSSSQTLTLTPIGSGLLGLDGFQLDDTSSVAVPEPSTWAMLLGGAGLLVWCLRARKA